MISVSLSGGIGSGKSTVLKVFSFLKIPSYNADQEAKFLLDTNKDLKASIIANFGDVYLNGSINRKQFAEIIFNNEENRKLANSIIHPFVRDDFQKWMGLQKSKYVIQEAAIIFETGAYKLFDRNILVCAPEDLRIKRIIARDGMDESLIRTRMKAQWKDEQKIPLADFCIMNDEKHSLIDQVLSIHKSLMNS